MSVDRAIVGPQDNRTHEFRTRMYPYHSVCHLSRDFGEGMINGCTGALIGPRTVLTAAHCLFSRQRGKAPLRIVVSPGRNDLLTFPFGMMTATEYYIPEKYINASNMTERKNHDFGIIILPRRFSPQVKFMRLTSLSDRQLAGLKRRGKIHIAGYPGDRPKGTLWRHAENIKKVSPNRLYYSVDTCPGHSGSPIWVKKKGEKTRYLIGVHTSGITTADGRIYGCKRWSVMAPPGSLNSGVRINNRIFRAIVHPKARIPGGIVMVKPPKK